MNSETILYYLIINFIIADKAAADSELSGSEISMQMNFKSSKKILNRLSKNKIKKLLTTYLQYSHIKESY